MKRFKGEPVVEPYFSEFVEELVAAVFNGHVQFEAVGHLEVRPDLLQPVLGAGGGGLAIQGAGSVSLLLAGRGQRGHLRRPRHCHIPATTHFHCSIGDKNYSSQNILCITKYYFL